MISALALSTLGNTLELSSGDLRKANAFDSIKATWNQALKIGDLPGSTLSVEYDSSVAKESLKEATLSGAIFEPSEAKAAKGRSGAVDASDLSVTYEVSHDFASNSNALKLSASTVVEGYTVGAELDDANGLSEVSATRDLDVADQSINAAASWLVKAKTARVKLMSKLSDNDNVNVEVNYTPDGGATTYEVGLDHSMGDGRDLSAKVDGDNLEVDYVDSKFEDGATWTASASVPVDAGNNILDAAKLSLKRSWKW